MSEFGRILVVEDDPRDVELTLTALDEYKLANDVVVVRDGEEAWTICITENNSRLAPKKARPSFCWI